MTGIIVCARKTRRKLLEGLRLHGKEIAYYGSVALALTLIAVAAEHYRSENLTEPAVPALPAIELTVPDGAEEDEIILTAPEGAELLRSYAAAPEWNATLALWETHTATDYQMEDCEVASLSAGIVQTVGKSGVYGGFVEVICGDCLLRYASIAPRDGLTPGDALTIGDSIGRADQSMPSEAELGAHLHLELLREGAFEDFAALCSET